MILNDFNAPKEKFSREKLDTILAELCGLVLQKHKDNPDFYGMVGAAVLDPRGYLVTGVNYLYGNQRIHAERAAIDKYEEEYGELPKGCIVVTTLSPCNENHTAMAAERYSESCTDLLNEKRVKMAYCGYSDPTQENKHNKFTVIVTNNNKIKTLCKKLSDTFLKKEINEDSSNTAISLSRLPKFFKGTDPLVDFVPERGTYRFALPPTKWEGTFFSLTNKDPRKLKFYGPKQVEIVPGTLVGDMAIANRFYRTTNPEEKEQLAQEYKKSLKPYTGDVSGYRMPELLIPNTINELKIDNVNGLGSVPWNQEVDYMGLKVLMKPSTFLQLSLPLNMGDEDRKTIAHLEKEKDTRGFGAPFLQVDVDREFPRITGHDGRHRMLAIKDTEGDHPVEVHIFPRGMRNKDITPEVVNKLNDLVVSQNGKYVPGPIFTQTTNENFADGKGPGRPGDSQRHGIPKGATMAELEKASHAKGRKGQLARWQLNMRRGKKK
jgi:pyrimidine deaminase RibD-like protein